MKMRKCVCSLFLAIAVLLTMCVPVIAADSTTKVEKGDIVVLYTNDVHCGVDEGVGYAGVAAYEKDMLALTDYVTLADAGDAIQGEALGTLSSGGYPIQIMNAMGYDICVPGNHEFDYGMERFLELSDELDCGYYCCNFIDFATGKPVFDAYKMITYGDTKVAYVGIDTPEAISKSTPAYFQNANGEYAYGFCNGNDGQELYDAVQSAVDSAVAEGADYVIAVGHCGVVEQSEPWRSTDIINNVSGLSAFIDGHSHSTIASQSVADKDGETVLLTSTGTKLAYIGKLVIKTDGTVSTGLVAAEDYTKKDDTVDAFVKEIQAQNAALLKKVVAKTDVDLTDKKADGVTRAVRSEETNLGDFAADAYRAIGEADVAFVNGGGIRASIAKGDITYEQIIAVHPYGNALCVVKATGREILDALEMAYRFVPNESGGFLQVSGITFTVDTTKPTHVVTDENKLFIRVDGEYRVSNVVIGGKPIDLDAEYTVASHDYMIKKSGDGINMFSDNEIIRDSIMLDNQVLITYITENLNGSVPSEYARQQSRINIIREPFADVTSSEWYYDGVVYAFENSLLYGVETDRFAPYAAMTRGQLVTVLWRMSGSPETALETSFTDVADDSYCAKAVSWALENGIAFGDGKLFTPEEKVTREQFAAFLYRYASFKGEDVSAEAELTAFEDAESVSNYAEQAVSWAVARNLIAGSDGKLDPDGTASRCQAAVILMRYCLSAVASV